jgi:hypothetical protein
MYIAIQLIDMKKYTIIISIILVLITAGHASSERRSSILNVSATVLPYVKYSVQHQKGSVEVTEEDIERGYLNIGDALTLNVKTNSINGYILNLIIDDTVIKGFTLINNNIAYNISGSGGEVHMPYQGKNYLTKEFSLRLYLLKETKPGTYSLPMAIAAYPI